MENSMVIVTKEVKERFPGYVRRANVIARQYGYGFATAYQFGDCEKIISRTNYGWRKNTTDEYVPNAYRANFGWKNTYYQNAITIVQIKSSLT
jgi:hypothetical protein